MQLSLDSSKENKGSNFVPFIVRMDFPLYAFSTPFCSARLRQYNLILNIFEIHTHTLIEVQFRLYLDFNRLFLTVTKKLDFSIDGEYRFVFIWKQYTVIVMPFILKSSSTKRILVDNLSYIYVMKLNLLMRLSYVCSRYT